MKRTIAGLSAFIGIVAACPASAGDWQWGCMGPLGDEQILFSRFSLIIAPAKPALGKLQDLYTIADLGEKFPEAAAYNAEQTNDGLQKQMTYTAQDNPRNSLTLTEKSSKDISHRHRLVCGRDEETSIERKVYRVERSNAAAVDVTLQCREYLLTTRGGRPCINK